MKLKIITGALGAAFFAGLAVVYNFSPSQYSFYPRCPFYAATHWLCPGCGSTRALYSLLHGQWGAALHYNAMFTLLLPVVLGWLIFCFYRVMRYDRFPRLNIPRNVTVGVGIAVLLFTVTRNIFFAF
ncbi:MAG TPA: DUF2752 domain-containing protein [Candidatus Angelobacter sp.]|nr:DUF2752 domain-containing protein [Candidatus Angelobacter sp.]